MLGLLIVTEVIYLPLVADTVWLPLASDKFTLFVSVGIGLIVATVSDVFTQPSPSTFTDCDDVLGVYVLPKVAFLTAIY